MVFLQEVFNKWLVASNIYLYLYLGRGIPPGGVQQVAGSAQHGALQYPGILDVPHKISFFLTEFREIPSFSKIFGQNVRFWDTKFKIQIRELP